MKNLRAVRTFSSTIFGNVEGGALLRNIDDALAEHLVNEACVAEYVDATPAAADAQADADAQAVADAKAAKASEIKAEIAVLETSLAEAKPAKKAAIEADLAAKQAELAAL